MRDRRRRGITVLLAVTLMTPLALPAAASAQAGDAFVDGAEPWTESDCPDDVPIVVSSDAAAQSDVYSAVTLAGVVDTDCVILAGARDGDMSASQQTRLNAAAVGGYIVGGTSAVRLSKTAGRTMTRLAGADRWATAQLVGRHASGDTTAGTSTSDEAISGGEEFASVSAGGAHSCGVRTNGQIEYWGNNDHGQSDEPEGTFSTVSAGHWHSCGVRTTGTVTCWGGDGFRQTDAATGAFTSVSAGIFGSCGLRRDGTIECWGSLANRVV